jgi:uncharacterized protein (TIGR02271 family)
MAKTIVGLFDDFSEAQKVVQDLANNGFAREDISIAASDATGEYARYKDSGVSDVSEMSGTATGAATGAVLGGIGGLLVGLGALTIPGIGPIIAAGPLITTLTGAGVGAVAGGLIGALTDIGVPEEEAGYYAEGVRRGGTLVTVRADDHLVDRAVDIMERHDAVDVDQRATYWRESGWDRYNPQAQPYTSEEIARERDRYRTWSSTSKVAPAATPRVSSTATSTTATTAQDLRSPSPKVAESKGSTIPVVEEQMQVGKRAVQRGVRVYSHVVEKPVEESVRLREERVHVERRPVDRPASSADLNALKDRTIEVTETREEPVVSKQARVVEEVAVRKEAQERTETVRDTVRRTDVNVEQQGAQGKMATDFAAYDADFRSNYNTAFAKKGLPYERWEPAYRYGYTLASDQRYAGKDWAAVEMDARRDWEGRHQGAWEEFKDAIRYAWDKVRGRTRRAA